MGINILTETCPGRMSKGLSRGIFHKVNFSPGNMWGEGMSMVGVRIPTQNYKSPHHVAVDLGH